jgi:hypothetical protein
VGKARKRSEALSDLSVEFKKRRIRGEEMLENASLIL